MFDWIDAGETLETPSTLDESRVHKRDAKRKLLRIAKRTAAREFIRELPASGETWHIISNAKYDFWTWAAVIIDLMGGRADTLYGSTWTMSRDNVIDMFELYDAGKIGAIAILTGTYFKRRESSVYATLLEAIRQRGQRFICFENHAKVMLLSGGGAIISPSKAAQTLPATRA